MHRNIILEGEGDNKEERRGEKAGYVLPRRPEARGITAESVILKHLDKLICCSSCSVLDMKTIDSSVIFLHIYIKNQ